MPTYEYRCPTGHEFEHFNSKISDSRPTLPCPTCGEMAERRISGGAGLLFKGSGFYITDYGKDGKKEQKPAAKAGGAAASSGGAESKGGGEAKGADAKPAAAPASAPAKPPSSGGGE